MLAWVQAEAAAERVDAVLKQADAGQIRVLMSWINAGEVYYMLVRKRSAMIADEFLTRLPSLPIRLVLPEEPDIVAAAKLKATRRLAYADAFAASLALREGGALMTGDPELRELQGMLTIEWLGR